VSEIRSTKHEIRNKSEVRKTRRDGIKAVVGWRGLTPFFCQESALTPENDMLHWSISWLATGGVTRGGGERGASSTQNDNEKRSDPF